MLVYRTRSTFMTKSRVVVTLFAAVAAACAPSAVPVAGEGDSGRVTRVADEFVAAFFERTPEAATRRGLPNADHGGVIDNSLAAIARWHKREDAWLAELRRIDPSALAGRPQWVEYGILRELLEGLVAVRVCRMELWEVSTTAPGCWCSR